MRYMMKWNKLWTHSGRTVNTLWAHSEHILNTLWTYSEDKPKIWQNPQNINQSVTDSLSNIDPRDASASKIV